MLHGHLTCHRPTHVLFYDPATSRVSHPHSFPSFFFSFTVDCDEVLGAFLPPLIEFVNHKYKMNMEFNMFNSYHFSHVWGGTDADANRICCEYFETDYFKSMTPLKGAFEVLNKYKDTFRFVVVTSRQTFLTEITTQWINRHFNGIFDKIRFGNHYDPNGGKKLNKSEMCEEEGAQILIDDSLVYAEEAMNSKTIKNVLLFDLDGTYMWSKNSDGSLPELPDGVHR